MKTMSNKKGSGIREVRRKKSEGTADGDVKNS